jgi:hypothetical protein
MVNSFFYFSNELLRTHGVPNTNVHVDSLILFLLTIIASSTIETIDIVAQHVIHTYKARLPKFLEQQLRTSDEPICTNQ